MALGPAQKAEIVDLIYSERGIPAASKKANLPLRTVMEAIDEDDEFQRKVEKALTHLTAVGEQELMRRAIDGTESYVTSQGRIVQIVDEDGHSTPLVERKYSDGLLSQFLKARKKEIFGDKVEIEHTHKGHIAVPVISQEALMRALETGSPLDFTPQSIIDAEYQLVDQRANMAEDNESSFEFSEADFDII